MMQIQIVFSMSVILFIFFTAEVQSQPITITKTQDLVFGSILPGNTSGTVSVAMWGGNRSSTGGVILIPGPSSQAQFTVAGSQGSPFSITLPSSVSLTSGSNSMTVNGFTSSLGSMNWLWGTQTLNVGATLNIGARQQGGSYTGTFNVTVAYF